MSYSDQITFSFDWEDPQGARGEELRATWARLDVRVDNHPVLKVEDLRTRSVRDYVYLPLYPIAEWLAFNWWPLLAEVSTPQRQATAAFSQRHNLRFAREGFALPDLRLEPAGGSVAVEWKPVDLPGCVVRFTERGSARLDETQFRGELTNLVEAVVTRLDESGVHGTPLQTEWPVIRQAAKDELDFCLAAGALGLDPYSLDEHTQQAILSAHATLPESTLADFLYLADPAQIDEQAALLHTRIVDLQNTGFDLGGLRGLKTRLDGRQTEGTAWEHGYRFARHLRATLGIENTLVTAMDDFPRLLDVSSDDFEAAVQRETNGTGWFDALMAPNRTGSPAFAIAKRHEDAVRFAFCRALYGYLAEPVTSPSLISAAHSEKQQSNRAFAAEFLAPAEMIRSRLRGSMVCVEEVDELAAEFGVSSYVIHHQIENHRLARVEPAELLAP